MITIRIKESNPGEFEAFEVQKCKCGPDIFILVDKDIKELKKRVKELYKSGQPTPTKFKFIE